VPVLVLIPGFWEPEYPVEVRRRQLLQEVARRHRVAFLDASPVLERTGKKNAYIPGDTHLSALGHQALARELHDLVGKLPHSP
jgi:lysophospholipase L1-like esterase